jgi:hypothetical protein
MFPLFAAFLLAAWLLQPWTYVDLPGDDAHAQEYVAAVRSPSTPGADSLDLLLLKQIRTAHYDAQVPPAPAPLTTPAPALAPPPASIPTPAPAPAYVPPPEGLEAIICAYPGPCQEAVAVALCESGADASGRPDGVYASSRTGYGLFQINPIHVRRFPDFWESWMDPEKNTAWAYQIWAEQGWRPWACRPR